MYGPAALAEELTTAISADYSRLEALFHHFHANPEFSMQEFKKSDRIAAELEAERYEVTRGIAKTGLVGILRNGAGPVVMIRADMDGLPVQEKSGLAYASRARQVHLDGVDMPVMHACGHDMHITTLIGVARQLKARKADWRWTAMLLAQPAEENLDGADTVSIEVHGIASQIVIALQTIVTREVSPLEPAITTVGSFHSGTASNVISDNALLEITLRSNSESTRDLLLKSIERVAINTARAAGLPED